MASLDPSGGLLIDTIQNTYTTETITAVDFSDISWTWSLEEIEAPSGAEGRNIIITENGGSLEISYESDRNLFPVSIDYMTGGPFSEKITINSWGQLPEPKESPYIVAYRPSDVSVYTWAITVTATGTSTTIAEDGTSSVLPESVSGTYDITIHANNDSGKDILVAVVEERKEF